MTEPRVIVLGGGFAGLYLAKGLANRPVRVTLIDRNNHHVFQPLLYQVATAALSPGDIAAPIRSVLHRASNIEVVMAEATAVDLESSQVRLADGSPIGFDYLVVATGARHAYFGRPDWERLAPGLKTLEDALEIRRRILLAFERAEREPDPGVRARELSFVVVGGGPTGVELAGAMAEIRRFALKRDFRRLDPGEATVLLLEGGARILPSYPEVLSRKATRALVALGVDVRTESLVTAIEPGFVVVGGNRLPAGTVVWAAGNQASPLLRTLGCPLDRQGRVLVEPDLTVPNHKNVFVLGDAAAFVHQKGFAVLPAVSPTAIQMGKYAARAVLNDLRGRPRRPFHYFDKGQLAVIGRARAVAEIQRVKASGFIAWILWISIHIFYLIGFRNRVLVMIEWAWSYFTFERGARLITDPWVPGDGGSG